MVLMTTAITATVATIVCGVEAVSIINTLSRGFIIQSLKYSMNGALDTVTKITKFDQPTIKQVTKELVSTDIKHKVELIKILVEELEQLKEHYDSKSIDFALSSLVEQMNLINRDLDIIQKAIEEHLQKYLSGWRMLCCKNEIESIIQKKTILDSRYKELIGLLGLHKLLSSSKSDPISVSYQTSNEQLKIEASTTKLRIEPAPNSKSWISGFQNYVAPYTSSLVKQTSNNSNTLRVEDKGERQVAQNIVLNSTIKQ